MAVHLRVLLALAAALALGGCDKSDPCSDPDAPETCGCGRPCTETEACVAGVCVDSSTEACGPRQVRCGVGEACEDGVCRCSPELTRDNDRACGCPSVDCRDLVDTDGCVDGVCICRPEFHLDDDEECGCPPVRCATGDACHAGVCECQPVEHLVDSTDCACLGACDGEHVCNAGRCVCGPGSVSCGDHCIPSGSQCCNAGGDQCPAGTTCEFAASGVLCRPSTRVPCYDTSGYVGSCSASYTCQRSATGLVCAPPGTVACYQGGFYAGFCETGYACSPDATACIPNTWSICGDGTTFCSAGDTCTHGAGGWSCRPNGTTACFGQTGYTGVFCEAGYACSPDGTACIPSTWSTCGDGTTFCPAGDTCMQGAGGWSCRPNGTTACFDQTGYTGFCEAGYACHPWLRACIPPGFQLCGDLLTTCSSATTCRRTMTGYVCAPNETVPCYDENGWYVSFCNLGWACDVEHDQCVH